MDYLATYELFDFLKKKPIPKSEWDLMSDDERVKKLISNQIPTKNDPYCEEEWGEEEELNKTYHDLVVKNLVMSDQWTYYSNFPNRLFDVTENYSYVKEFKKRIVNGENPKFVCINLYNRLKEHRLLNRFADPYYVMELDEVIKKIKKFK